MKTIALLLLALLCATPGHAFMRPAGRITIEPPHAPFAMLAPLSWRWLGFVLFRMGPLP